MGLSLFCWIGVFYGRFLVSVDVGLSEWHFDRDRFRSIMKLLLLKLFL
jgi:hypothetical protein